MPCEATWMKLEIIILSKTERERKISYNITYISKKKKIQMNLLTKHN